MMRTALLAAMVAWAAAPCAFGCGGDENGERSLEVIATAYNSVPSQTDDDPWLAAWGDSLTNGMRVIAVSRDLIELGLGRGTVVQIDGLAGEYVVLDKMNKRWTRRIDLYMGDDVPAALRFGKRDLTIRWTATALAAEPPVSSFAEAEAN